MQRTVPILAAVMALILVIAASALASPAERAVERAAPDAASHQPEPEGEGEDEGTPSQELLDRLVSKLGEAGVTTDASTIAALAADYGVGGAVRLLSWSAATGTDPAALGLMFDSGLGWGEIARQLNEGDETLDLHPGIGRIMGNAGGNGAGQGLGRAGAPGQLKKTQ